AWAAEPPKQLKTGGLGVSILRPLSTRLDVDVTDAARIVELLWLAGLLEVHTVTRKEGRLHVTDSFVRPTGAAAAWLARSTSVRWRQLATAWRRAERWPSAAGRPDPNGKAVPVLSPQPRGDAAALRAEVLAAVAALDDADGGPADRCAATSAAALAASVYWTCPEPWLHNPIGEHATMISWIYEEAELLGVIAEGRMSNFGRALLDGDAAAAGRLFDAARPTLATSFTVQADLTVVVVGAGAREVTTELRLLADVESTGAATTYRITETGIRRAIDAGRDAASILAFLRAHATRGLPTALEYLVGDVERRHGHLRVASATTVITADDPAVLADACAHRLSRKLGLRLLAPTVATSALPIDKVVGGLRAAGFFPASDDGGAAPQEGAIGLSPAVERSAGDDAELPERFAHRAARTTSPPALDAASAAALAAAIISAAPEGDGRPQRARGATADVLPFDDQREGLHALLSAAAHAGHVVAVARGGGRADDKPILLTNVDWDGGMLRGTSLLDGLSVELHPDEIETALDAGPFDGMFNDRPRRPARSKQRRRR
ncbi:MAG: helicase-associated domain-containing protein, partial [Acidimicrobiales bacterium]